ncbi:hypothetical protein LROSRS0_1231 [Furfurilactobacillus rossiae]|nr:hypothetical protein [Furfurilactobacillus rossiae]QLE61277.1 hypothetical protein LROSRS0_1231 [Furfurilactobacillus rossiae]
MEERVGQNKKFMGLSSSVDIDAAEAEINKKTKNKIVDAESGVQAEAGGVHLKGNFYSSTKSQEYGAQAEVDGYTIQGHVGFGFLKYNHVPLFGIKGTLQAGETAMAGVNQKNTKIKQLVPHMGIYQATSNVKFGAILGVKLKVSYPILREN